jgi:hypothetical protein
MNAHEGIPSVARLALWWLPRLRFFPLVVLPYSSEGKLAGVSVMMLVSGGRMLEDVFDRVLKRSVYR